MRVAQKLCKVIIAPLCILTQQHTVIIQRSFRAFFLDSDACCCAAVYDVARLLLPRPEPLAHFVVAFKLQATVSVTGTSPCKLRWVAKRFVWLNP